MRYMIGIDLGTTNSSMAYVDTQKPQLAIQLFSIPQLVSAGHVDVQLTLPSFCYLPGKEEWPAGSLSLPWKKEVSVIVGQFAKVQGTRVPTRLVQSAKSWLCNVAANRKEKILPIEAADPSQRLSPVEASAHYLMHLKEAWNATLGKGKIEDEFEEQEIILTVPASFDEVARSLTVEAARLAGLQHVTLLEEPQAAFYSWISQHENQWQQLLKAGETILVCDVGGGTTDFSLIEVHLKEGKLVFQRMAVGDHLLLGGDNMDVALAHYLEKKIQAVSSLSLESDQWLQLQAAARLAKESLLHSTSQGSSSYPIVLQGTGSSVVKGSLTASIEREELESFLLEGFFGQYPLQQALELRKSRGFRTMGLPYEDEPSITKHLARFLQQAGYLDGNRTIDYLLFNGGAMKPLSFQKVIQHSLSQWFAHKNPTILESTSLDLAVAKGAAYYGKVRRGLGVAIGGGSSRTYYLELDVKDGQGEIVKKALTLLLRGSEEGSSFQPERSFLLRPNTPVAFHLLTSHVRLHDQQGELVDIDEQEMHPLPPIHTILRFGRRQASADLHDLIPVRLGIRLTAIGTIELWLESEKTEHQWTLEFQLRAATGQENSLLTVSQKRQDETFQTEHLNQAKQGIEELFSGHSSSLKPSQIMEKLEELLESERKDWSPSVLRGLYDSLIKWAAKRKLSPDHEARWWNMVGFFLRPGFGFPLDDFRIKELWKIILGDLKASKSQECQIQQWICYRRMGGGLNKGQQMQLASELMISLLNKQTGKVEAKSKRELYLYAEKIRALASLERLDPPLKIRLGEMLVSRIVQKEAADYDYWALARIGARHLIYGSVGHVVPKETCGKWVKQLLLVQPPDQLKDSFYFVLGQLARQVEQRELNLPEPLIQEILAKDETGDLKRFIFNERELTENEQEKLFGDRLPVGLILEV